jgi:hypothetical protein
MDARYKIAEAMMRGVGQPMAAFPDQRQDADMSLRGMASDLYQADQKRAQDYRAGISDALMQSWPAELAKSAYGAVTLPGDVYAGKVNPMSDEAVGRSAELAGLMTLGAGAVPAGRNEMRMGIKAYHGSPHDFDQFSMSKIGTGEGAQAYGHGLYFAGNEDVARGYRQTLSRRNIETSLDGQPITSWPTTIDALQKKDWRLARYLDEYGRVGGDRDEFIKRNRNWYRDDDVEQAALSRFAERVQSKWNDGRMYEVNLNTTPDRLLDWDKPLADQPETIRRALGWTPDAEKSYRAAQSADDDALLGALMGDAGAYTASRPPVPKGLPPLSATGADIAKGSSIFDRGSDAYKAQGLRERGIDGIKYLDGGSRAAGEGSRNYVMFNDKLVQILRKYGVATAAALPAAALAELGMSREEAKRSF